jgi:peptidoglycan/LPS O-acetylase OafA/YrhL
MILLIGAYCVLKVFLDQSRFAWMRDLCAGAIASSLIAWCCVSMKRAEGSRPLLLLIFESPLCSGLGKISYSLYLTHCVLLNILVAFAHNLRLSPEAALALRTFLGVPSSIFLAGVFYHLFERPFLGTKHAARWTLKS